MINNDYSIASRNARNKYLATDTLMMIKKTEYFVGSLRKHDKGMG